MKSLFVMLLSVLLLSACGGGGGSNVPISSTVSGTASQGAPISGSVTLKDSKGVTKTGSINTTTGAYSIVVDGMSAPFILKAGNYYSVASSATTTNINPLTDLCTQTAAGSTSVGVVFTDPTQQLSTLATKLPGIVVDLKTSLNALYPSSVPDTQRDFMNGSLTIDQGVDFVLKNISISSASGNMTINYNLQALVSVTMSNNVVTVTPDFKTITAMANDIHTAIGGTSTSTTFSANDFVGTWIFTYVGDKSTITGTIIFTSDGKFSYTGQVSSSTGGIVTGATNSNGTWSIYKNDYVTLSGSAPQSISISIGVVENNSTNRIDINNGGSFLFLVKK